MVDLLIVLHCHIPYVRKRGIWPYGEEWIFEAMLESYIPLVNVFNDLSLSGGENLATVSLSPILLEQLSDDHIKNGFNDYLETKIKLTSRDVQDFTKKGWNKLSKAAKHRLSALKDVSKTWSSISGDLPKAVRNLNKKNLIEIAGSSATHAILPLLSAKSIERQVSVGLKSIRQRISYTPTTFWLPECAYKLGLEEILEDNNINTVFLGSRATDELHRNRPFTLGNTDVIALARNWELSKRIWSFEDGYPGDPRFREFQKRYRRSGNRYWRITGSNVNPANKAVYQPEIALELANNYANEFVSMIEKHSTDNTDQSILLSIDAELMGQDWYEGVEWLKTVLLQLENSKHVNLSTPQTLHQKYNLKKLDSQRPSVCSWIKDGDLRPWNRGSVLWMWDDIGTMSSKFFDLKKDTSIDRSLIAQLERELMLCQSSDWPFLVTTKSSKVYGEKRFRMHRRAFWNIVDLIETDFIDFNFEQLSDNDNPFPFLG